MRQRDILRFWLPLLASWLLMTLEGPILYAFIGHLSAAETQIAAFGIVLSLEITIESPVIMLLATSTALATSGPAYFALRRFMLQLNVALTAVAALLAFTPLFALVVIDLLGIPPAIAEAARPAMQVMTLWTAAIGWRRFHQGILIRTGRTGSVGVSTFLRLLASAGVGAALALATDLPGATIGGCALMAGVLVEAAIVQVLVAPAVRELREQPATGAPLTGRRILAFHVPLAATSLLTLLIQPAVHASLARLSSPSQNLAAWPVLFSIFLLFQCCGLALPETVIALLRNPANRPALRRFVRRVGLVLGSLYFLFILTPALPAYLRHVTGLSAELTALARHGAWFGLLIPLLHLASSWYRGQLMAAGRTGSIYRGMALQLVIALSTVAGGVMWQRAAPGSVIPGIVVATLALTLARAAEVAFLGSRLRRG